MTAAPAARDAYLERLAASDEEGAITLVLEALDAGADPVVVLLDVVAAAQREIGERWARGEWTVVQEHLATHISERAVAAVVRHRPASRTEDSLGVIAVACLDGEWHGLPARLLAEVLARSGWTVQFLGTSVPAAQLAVHLHDNGPDLVAISSSLPSRLPGARRMVEVCQAAGTPILAGGAAFGADGRWARAVGADGWAPDARVTATMLAAWTGGTEGLWAPPPHGSTGSGDDGDDGDDGGAASTPVDATAREEQAVLYGRRGELIAAVAHRLRGDGPVPDELADDLGLLVDFLAAAVFVDDASLLAEFLRWIGAVSIPQGLGAAEVGPVLTALADVLRDSPRTHHFLLNMTPSPA